MILFVVSGRISLTATLLKLFATKVQVVFPGPSGSWA